MGMRASESAAPSAAPDPGMTQLRVVGIVLSHPSEARMGHPFFVIGEGQSIKDSC